MARLASIKKATVGLFWRETKSEASDLAPQPTLPALSTVELASLETQTPGAVDSEFFAALESELSKARSSEFTEFYNQMTVINEKFANLDEPTRYQLAFHAAQTALKARGQSLSYPVLIKAIERLGQVLETEKKEFAGQNETGYQENLSQIRSKVEKLAQEIKARETRLQSIQQEIDAFLAAKGEERKRIEAEKAQLATQRAASEEEMSQIAVKKAERDTRFNSALTAHQDKIAQLRDELEQHLKKTI
jgi:chromosome segregation ATPase